MSFNPQELRGGHGRWSTGGAVHAAISSAHKAGKITSQQANAAHAGVQAHLSNNRLPSAVVNSGSEFRVLKVVAKALRNLSVQHRRAGRMTMSSRALTQARGAEAAAKAVRPDDTGGGKEQLTRSERARLGNLRSELSQVEREIASVRAHGTVTASKKSSSKSTAQQKAARSAAAKKAAATRKARGTTTKRKTGTTKKGTTKAPLLTAAAQRRIAALQARAAGIRTQIQRILS